jgi:hypothetical protein
MLLENEVLPIVNLFSKDQIADFSKKNLNMFIKNSIYFETNRVGLWNPLEDERIFKKYASYIISICGNHPTYVELPDAFNEDDIDVNEWYDFYSFAQVVYVYNLFDKKIVKKMISALKSELFKWILDPYKYDYSKFESKWLKLLTADVFYNVLSNIEPLKSKTIKQLETEFDPEVSKIYFLRLLKPSN